MDQHDDTLKLGRRDFFKTAGAGLTAAGVMMTPREQAIAQTLAEKARFERMAGCTWPIRFIFKTRQQGGRGGPAAGATGAAGGRGAAPAGAAAPGGAPGGARAGAPAAAGAGGRGDAAAPGAAAGRGGGGGRGGRGGVPMGVVQGPDGAMRTELYGVPIPAVPANRNRETNAELKVKFGEITMLDYPQWMKDNFPGLTRMDLFSGLFGDVTDDSMFITAQQGGGGGGGFDPMSPSGRKWIDQLGNVLAKTGTHIQHISNNAPFALADFGSPEADARRKAGVAMATRWLEGLSVLKPNSMRMNSPQALGPQLRPPALGSGGDGYPRNLDLVPLMAAAIESYKEMADIGGKFGTKVTFENHWGLAADPMNIRIMIDTVNHPFCDATPDFCNWEHEYMLFNGLKALAPYSTSNVHAKYWDRWGDKNDVQRSVRIMLAGGFKGTFALEYEAGPLNGIDGAKFLYKEVLAALTTPIPAM